MNSKNDSNLKVFPWTSNQFIGSLLALPIVSSVYYWIDYLYFNGKIDEASKYTYVLVVIACAIIFIYAVNFLFQKLKYLGIVSKVFDIFSTLISSLLTIILNPTLLLVVAGILIFLLTVVDVRTIRIYIALPLSFFVLISFIGIRNQRSSASGKLVMFDDFNKIEGWANTTGAPIRSDTGKPAPGLLLPKGGGRTNTFMLKNTLRIKNGSIECDVYLRENAIFNLVFRVNSHLEAYMARLDTRADDFDSILFKDKSGWSIIKENSKTKRSTRRWYAMKVVFLNKSISLFIDNELVLKVSDDRLVESGNFGFFNECGDVIIDNFVVHEY